MALQSEIDRKQHSFHYPPSNWKWDENHRVATKRNISCAMTMLELPSHFKNPAREAGCQTSLILKRIGPGYHLQNLLGDGRLPCLVIGQSEGFDQGLGIVASIVHRRHPSGQFAGGCLL
jgi:hypothetical protein